MDVQTERLRIRDLKPDDWPAMHALHMAPEVGRFQTWFSPRSEDETRAALRGMIEHNQRRPRFAHNCAIVLKNAGEAVGWIGFGHPEPDNQTHGDLDFGYALLPL